MKLFLVVLGISIGFATWADQSTTGGNAGFEVVDISGQITGDPATSADEARASWKQACTDWKNETKDLNKNNQILGINCNNPTCHTIELSKTQCLSNGTYQVKTAGQKVKASQVAPPLPEPPAPAPLPPEHEIAVAPPAVIVEAVPPPRPGFIWIGGYWGWEGRRHVWIPGRWAVERPGYIWVRGNWTPRGRGWRFEEGRWESRH